MQTIKSLLQATLSASMELARPPNEARQAGHPTLVSAIVPIRTITEKHRNMVLKHLLELDARSRYLRFGYAATDEQIHRYVESINFDTDTIFGIFNRRLKLLAVAHLAHIKNVNAPECCEFGVSVDASARHRGYGTRLFERAANHATNDGIRLMFIHALSENAPMIKIAKSAGATLKRDGSETEAYLELPAATVDSQIRELVDEQIAVTDYNLKQQAKQFWHVISEIQAIRRDAIDALRRSGR